MESDKAVKTEKGICETIIEQIYKKIVYFNPTDLGRKCNSMFASEDVNDCGIPIGIKEGCINSVYMMMRMINIK